MTRVIIKIEESGGVRYDLRWTEDSASTAAEKRQAEALANALHAALRNGAAPVATAVAARVGIAVES